MNFFVGSPFLKALGWALLNSVWQFGIMWLLFWMLSATLRKLTAAARHTLAVYLLSAGSIWFLISLSLKYYSYPAAEETSFAIQNTTYYNAYHSIEQSMDGLMPYWSVLYLLCIAVLFIKFCLFIRQAGELQTKGISKMPVDWRIYVKNIAVQLGIKKKVEVVLSSIVDTPQVVGFLKPLILVPIACLNHLTAEQLEAVLLHELVHIKRNDHLTNIFLATAEILFFFNPFVKQLAAAARREREYSCDDMVIQFRHQPHNYASALLALEQNRKSVYMFGIAASGQNQRQLLARVQRIIGMKSKQQHFTQAGAYLFTLLLLGFVAMVNPAKVAVDKVMPAIITLTNSKTTAPTDKETGMVVTNNNIPVKKEDVKKTIHTKLVALVKAEALNAQQAEDNGVDVQPVAASADQVMTVTLQNAAVAENRDFSLPENYSVSGMQVPTEEATTTFTPYVPSNSFSYQFMPDSTQPKTKRETYQERTARLNLEKAKLLALKSINWQKIEKNLKLSKRELTKLKTELCQQLVAVDWSKLNTGVADKIRLDQAQLLQQSIEQQKAIKEYQMAEATYQDIQKEQMERDQFIRETDKRLQDQRKALLEKEKKQQCELSKRRIIIL